MAKKNLGMKNFLFSFIIVCIVIYFFIHGNGAVDTGIAVQGTLEDIIKAKGIIIKDEEVFISNAGGYLTHYFDDGDKVGRGQLVADINTNSNSSEIKSEIDELELAIELKKNEDNLSEQEIVQALEANNKIEVSQSDLQNTILNKDIESMYNIIGQVDNSISVNSPVSLNKYEDYNINQLETMKANLLNSIGTNKIPYYSSMAGIITYTIDGLENRYNYDDVLNLSPSSTMEQEYIETNSIESSTVEKGDGIFKLIRSFDYYIAATVNNEYAKLFNENKYIKTRIIADDVESEAWGYIKKINYGSEESVLIIYFDDYFHKVYDKRYVDLQLITGSHDGLKIEMKSIVEKDGLTGVYVKDASNIVKFFPVEILGQDENNAVVSVGEYISEDSRRVINVDENIYETIKIFDKVILEAEKVYEGQILN